MKSLLLIETGIVMWGLLHLATNLMGQATKPNIIFIYTDDQASWALGASQDPNAFTPNLDQLTREGAYLVNSYVTTPVCSPSRVSLMTSRYASEYSIFDFIPHPNHRLYDPANKIGLPPESITFAEVLQQEGYSTGLVGKWHLGDWTQTSDLTYHPTRHGFDYFMGLTGGGGPPENPALEKDGEVQSFEGLTTDILTEHAISFIQDQKQGPFLLCLNYRAPHARWLPVAEEDWAPYKELDPVLPDPDYPDLDIPKTKQKMREYLASTSGVDRNVGRILEVLEQESLANRTVVIFTSDHGYNMGHNGIEHKGNGIWLTKTLPEPTENIASKYRPNLFDQSLRVPSIVRWPGVIPPGTMIEEVTSNLDWYPTLIAIAGVDLPENHIIRGRNLLPLLEGKDEKKWDNTWYAEYSMVNYCRANMRCIRTPDWKLIRDFHDPKRDELYHLTSDPEENVNRIHDTHPAILEKIEELDKVLKSRMKALGDPLLEEDFKGY